MSAPKASEKFVGVQVSPISIVDEGIEALLDTLQSRFGINVICTGTISWLGLKVGRRISQKLEGWPDHGVHRPFEMRGGFYGEARPEFYRNTFIDNFRATEPELANIDILATLVPAAHARGMKVYPDLMEPMFRYAGHGSVNTVQIPNLPQILEVDLFGRIAAEPCTSNPDYRRWWHSIIEHQCRAYAIDGIMWCNERKSPLDRLITGEAPTCFCETCRREAADRGIDVERAKIAFHNVYDFFQKARSGQPLADGGFVEFLRALLNNPEILLWERFWIERSKDLDKELYGITKWCSSDLEFGLNIWNRNHFNPFRKAQWSWAEQTMYSDWVKPIVYQHQSGLIFTREMEPFYKSIFRDVSPQEMTPIMYKFLGLNEGPWDELVQTGLQPETYVGGQARDTLRGVEGKVKVYMGIGVDAPRTRADQAVCTPEIAYRSVMAAYEAGVHGVIFAPSYAGMNHSTLDGAARALTELGLR